MIDFEALVVNLDAAGNDLSQQLEAVIKPVIAQLKSMPDAERAVVAPRIYELFNKRSAEQRRCLRHHWLIGLEQSQHLTPTKIDANKHERDNST